MNGLVRGIGRIATSTITVVAIYAITPVVLEKMHEKGILKNEWRIR